MSILFPIPRSLLSQKSPILCPVILKVERFCLPFCLLRFPQISIARLWPVTGANDNKTHSFRFCYSSFLHRHRSLLHYFQSISFEQSRAAQELGQRFGGGTILICSHPIICRGSHSMASPKSPIHKNETRTRNV